MRRATYADVCQWVATAWKQVPTKNITSGFSKAEITTGSPDADIDIDEDEPMDVSDDYRLTPELAALFNSDRMKSLTVSLMILWHLTDV